MGYKKPLFGLFFVHSPYIRFFLWLVASTMEGTKHLHGNAQEEQDGEKYRAGGIDRLKFLSFFYICSGITWLAEFASEVLVCTKIALIYNHVGVIRLVQQTFCWCSLDVFKVLLALILAYPWWNRPRHHIFCCCISLTQTYMWKLFIQLCIQSYYSTPCQWETPLATPYLLALGLHPLYTWRL